MVRIQYAAGGEGGIDLIGLGKIQKEWNREEQGDMLLKEYILRHALEPHSNVWTTIGHPTINTNPSVIGRGGPPVTGGTRADAVACRRSKKHVTSCALDCALALATPSPPCPKGGDGGDMA